MNQRLRMAVLLMALCISLVYGFVSGKLRRMRSGSRGQDAAQTPSQASTVLAPGNPSAGAPAATSRDSAGSAAVIPALPMKNFSDQEIQAIDNLPPQEQAERLMMAGVNHYVGATNMIMERVAGWRGRLKRTPNWDAVELAARYSSDLRVRSAAIEVDLVISGLGEKSGAPGELINDARTNVGNRGYDFYMLGMLANRGIETERIHAALREWAHDSDEGTRFWAIEGLAFLGTENTIPDFLEVLRNDPSLNVRQRCGASLAKSGMLTRVQRMSAVPGLIEIAADSSSDGTTRGWAFQALREITAEQIGNDAGAWRSWYSAHGDDRVEQFRRMDPNIVLGNS